MKYQKSAKYTDYPKIYDQCSGPGGLKLAEFMAEKMHLQSEGKLIDIGFNRGYQTCFLAKEYNIDIVGIDPWDDRVTGVPQNDLLMENAKLFGVSHKVLGVKSGLPNSLMPSNCFDYAYCTGTLEMIRGMSGKDAYILALKEIYRVLKKGGILGLGEPMHFDAPIPEEIIAYVEKNDWEKCFATIEETKQAVLEAGFEILQADYCEEANKWWKEYALYDPFNMNNPEHDEVKIINMDNNRWLSYGYVIARKPL